MLNKTLQNAYQNPMNSGTALDAWINQPPAHMPKPAQNMLTITPLADGRFFLTGYLNGKQVRIKRPNLPELEQLKSKMELEATNAALLEASKPVAQYTRLTSEQLQEAEALFLEFGSCPRPIAEYARAGLANLGVAELTLCTDALTNWLNWQRDEQKLDEATTIANNRQYLTKFFDEAKVKYVSDITNAAIENFCSLAAIGKGASMFSKLTRASRIRAFLNYCVAKKILAKTPFEMDVSQTLKLAKKNKSKTLIFNPGECRALLGAAIETDPRFIPFVLLSTWCFMRRSEVLRCTPEQVKLDRKVPFVEPESNKVGTASYRTANIPANILPLLRECIETGLWAKGTTPFFSDVLFDQLREKANLLTLGEPNAKGARTIVSSKWQPNILRHTGISMLYQKFSDLADQGKFTEESVIAAVTRQAGNSEDVAFEHYINIPDAAQAAEFYEIKGKLKKVIAQREERHVA